MSKKHICIAIVTILILLIPYVLNFPWTILDYLVAAILITATGMTLEVATRKIKNQKKKVLVSLSILLVALYVWAELAVGIFTNLGS